MGLKNQTKRKIIVVGLDGATFDLIIPWIKENKLPYFKQLLDEGSFSDLTSIIPPISPAAWTSFMTGKNPGKHGIYDFIQLKPKSYQMEILNSSHIQSQTIWSILTNGGKAVGAINIPMTYPPEEVNGFIISGLGAPLGRIKKDFTFPKELEKEITDNFKDYIITCQGKNLDDYSKSILDMLDIRIKVFRYLKKVKQWDLLMIVFSATDVAQHFFWQFMGPPDDITAGEQNSQYREMILKVYQRIDGILEEIIQEMDDETLLIIMSDHGFGPAKKTFFLNTYFKQKNLLATIDNPFRRLSNQIKKKVISRTFLLLRNYAPVALRTWLIKHFKDLRDSFESYLNTGDINWKKTRAFTIGHMGNTYINLKGKFPGGIVNSGQEHEELCDKIIHDLINLKDPDTGSKIISKVHRKDKLHWGSELDKAPDLMIEWKNYEYICRVKFGISSKSVFVDGANFVLADDVPVSGQHRLNGVFIGYGSKVKKNSQINNAHITDLAPTILYYLGLAIPEDMDGRVITDIFSAEFIENNPIHHCPSQYYKGKKGELKPYDKDEEEEIKKRLESLGYLG